MSWTSRFLPFLFLLLGGCTGLPWQAPPEAPEQETQESTRPDPETRFRTAVQFMQADRLDEARAVFQALHRADPTLTGPMANLGLIAYRQGREDAARAWFEKVLEQEPGHPAALNHRGILARKAEAFDQAEAYFRRALETDPDYRPAMINLAILLELYRGRLQEALALYERAQAQTGETEPRLREWIFDLRNRLEQP